MANGAAVRCARDPAGNQAALDLAGEPGQGREDLPRHRDQVQPGLDAKRRLPLRITLEDAGVVAPRTQDNTVQSNPLDTFRLDGRTALVTGARREIGRAIALGLAGVGARVAVHHAGTEEESRDAATVVAAIAAGGGTAQAFAQDFTEAGAGMHLAAAVTAWAPIDILVLNASIEIPEDWQGISGEHFDRQVTVNLRSTLQLLQALVPPMAERHWGRVLTIGSVQQVMPHPAMLVYAGTKAAQFNWVLNLARQYGGRGVTVNNLAPGAILTARNQAQMQREGAALAQRIPAGRLGAPDDLVGAALLLCSDAGRYMTGGNIYVDGGRHVA
jgi:glucose 1-dehydrogenase